MNLNGIGRIVRVSPQPGKQLLFVMAALSFVGGSCPLSGGDLAGDQGLLPSATSR